MSLRFWSRFTTDLTQVWRQFAACLPQVCGVFCSAVLRRVLWHSNGLCIALIYIYTQVIPGVHFYPFVYSCFSSQPYSLLHFDCVTAVLKRFWSEFGTVLARIWRGFLATFQLVLVTFAMDTTCVCALPAGTLTHFFQHKIVTTRFHPYITLQPFTRGHNHEHKPYLHAMIAGCMDYGYNGASWHT